MKKVFIVLLFILLGSALIVVNNSNKNVQNSFTIEYHNNTNLALPDVTGKTEITPNLYRYYNSNGLTLDYNIKNGQYLLNGVVPSGNPWLIIFDIPNNKSYVKLYYISGSSSDMSFPRAIIRYQGETDTYVGNQNLLGGYYINRNVQAVIIYTSPSVVYDNYTFKLQIESGSSATTYVVPKLVPVYKDNLTQQEKNEIGLGAFGGITKIIKTINDIIKPVGDFINGLLSMF